MSKDRELFDRIAAEYTRKDVHPAARLARRHRLEQTLAAAELPRDASVLEIGCGAGFSAEYLRGRFSRYLGVDYSEELIAWARRHHERDGVRFEAADAAHYEPAEKFDAVLMIGVVHHFENIPRMLSRIARFVRPGGLLIANEPHPGNPAIRAARSVRKRIDPSYSPDQRELSEAELLAELEGAGLENVRVVPQGLLTTPFAEVPLGPTALTVPIVRAACAVDGILERSLGPALSALTWNLIAIGRRPRAEERRQ